MIYNLKNITYIFILKLKNKFLEKSVSAMFRDKVLILLKDKRFLKFFIIGERRGTTANGGESSRTAICRSFFEFTNGQNSILKLRNCIF
jgi:hypothetical protein